MDKWEYIVGVQLGRPREVGEVSLEERAIIDHYIPPEIWLNKKGAEGWELVTVIQRYDYTEFFLKRKRAIEALSSDSTEEEAVSLAKQAEKYFAENDFEKTLQTLKQIQKLVGEKDR